MKDLSENEERAAWDEMIGRLRRLAGEVDLSAAGPWLRGHWLAWLLLVRELSFTAQADVGPLLVLWLDQAVEEAVDREWRKSPANAFLLDLLAAELCMAELRRRLPDMGFRACAPLPPATPGLRAALMKAGLASPAQPAPAGQGTPPLLIRRYAVLTYTSPRGCADCSLHAACPKICK